MDHPRVGNVIFVHPDGTGPSHWAAARAYWRGPDGALAWDGLEELAVYRGHMADQLTATSNGGATTHAFGVKVRGAGSFGRDGEGDDAKELVALSGYRGSIMREAANAGLPVGVVNDGDLAEPGTGAFLAEAGSRHDVADIVDQMVFGRPGADDIPPVVVLGGGERFLLPRGTPRCVDHVSTHCAVHADPVTGQGPMRQDGRNLVKEAGEAGWVVVRTRREFDALVREVQTRADYRPRVLGAFAADDTFNDVPEEELVMRGLTDSRRDARDRRGRLIIWGDAPGSRGANPPTAREMTELALLILQRHSEAAGKPFFLVVEVESTDNLANANNAIGSLRAIRRADEVIAAIRDFEATHPDTLLLTAADSDASGLNVISPPPVDDDGRVSSLNNNPTGRAADRQDVAADGMEGQGTMPFRALPDAAGRASDFAISWIGINDVAGGVIARAQGLNADALRHQFNNTLDNTDVYRLMYLTLFGRMPEASTPPARTP
ncbi:MAG: alkaline phosphatase [Gammaproteobacteria bacterium]